MVRWSSRLLAWSLQYVFGMNAQQIPVDPKRVKEVVTRFGGKIEYSDKSKWNCPKPENGYTCFIHDFLGWTGHGEGKTKREALQNAVDYLPIRLRSHLV